jgi:hypothetical protein
VQGVHGYLWFVSAAVVLPPGVLVVAVFAVRALVGPVAVVPAVAPAVAPAVLVVFVLVVLAPLALAVAFVPAVLPPAVRAAAVAPVALPTPSPHNKGRA